eukprot:scaffold571_cov364-Prasinococcus_capsulatus_cf.AAC.9
MSASADQERGPEPEHELQAAAVWRSPRFDFLRPGRERDADVGQLYRHAATMLPHAAELYRMPLPELWAMRRRQEEELQARYHRSVVSSRLASDSAARAVAGLPDGPC